jgi:hypothetical protein
MQQHEGLPLEWFCPTVAFPPGEKYITEGAEQALRESGEAPLQFLCRHLAKEWGQVTDEDKRWNDQAVATGGRLQSAYRTRSGGTIRVVTEADRSATTLSLPEEN